VKRNAPILCLALMLLTVPSFAQNTDIESLSGLPFNFANPGARSLGMGGAFLGLADDASAAEANPAGLTVLTKPEISIEGRNFETRQTFNTTGTFPDLETQTFNAFSRAAELSFASVVIPAGNFALAAYYHQPLRYKNSVDAIFTTQPLINFFLGPNGPVTRAQCRTTAGCLEYNLNPFYTEVDIDMKTLGVSGAMKFGPLSVGLGARYQQLDEGAFTFRTSPRDPTDLLSIVAQQADKEKDVTFVGGFKYNFGEKFSIGGSYKQGAEFETQLFTTDEQLNLLPFADSTFHVPDVAGLGVSLKPVQWLTINGDAVQVTYSNLVDNFVSVLTENEAVFNSFEAEDVTEYHVGAEVVLPLPASFAVLLRGGWWMDPAHAVTYRGPLNSVDGVAESILFRGSEDAEHYSVGIGLAWPRFQIDAAYDTSDSFKVGSISAVTRF